MLDLVLKQIYQELTEYITSMKRLTEDLTDDHLFYFRYAYITSTDVDRNFFRFTNILSDNRHRLKVENLKKALMVQCNKFTGLKKIIIYVNVTMITNIYLIYL